MKNIFKSIMMLLSGAVLFASCLKEAAPLASEISVNKQEVTFTGYAGSSAQIQKVQVTSNGDWFITCNEDWVTVNPSFGSAGMTKVEITVTDNVDSYNELNGPRSAVVNFCYGETGVAPLTVKQTGETGLDASRTYRKVTSQDQVVAGGYLVVFEYTKDGAAKTIALDPLSSATEDTYKYAYGSDVVIADDAITMPNANNAWILEAAEGGYLLQTAGKYLFQDGNSFRATTNKEKAHLWTVTIEENGEATIKNISFENRWIQFSVGYGSAGCYASAQENAVMPTLYVDSVPPTDEVLDVKDVTVPAFATSAKIKVQSNRSWSVRCHDEWIKSFTKTGKNNGEIEVTFDEYTSTTEDRTATFQVISEGTNTVITFTQAKVAPTMTVEEFLAEGVAKGDYAILTGSIENIKNTNYGNFDLQDATGTVYIYGLYDVNGAKVFTDLGLKEGDIVTLYGPKDVYNNNPQVKSAIYVSHESSKIRRKLAFSAETAEAKLGNSFTAPTLSGDATDVEYTSSDVEVATVDAATGEVTLLAEGTTTITANGPETETHLAGTASYTLTVTAKTPRALAFSAATAEATLGEEFTAPTLNGETAGVVYSSSDEEVATVDPATGAVTLVAAGETTITATAAEDESFLAGTASYTLTVAEPYIPAIEDGKYWIVANDFVAKPVTSTYGYLYVEDAWKSTSSVASTQANAFTFTSVEGGYTIQDEAGKYYYGTVFNGSWSKNFNVGTTLPAEGAIWSIVKNDDDTYTITNTTQPSYLQYSVSYASFGHYTTAQSNAVMPKLVKVETAIPSVTLPASLAFESEGGSQTITLPAGMTASASCDNAAFTASSSSNVVTVSATATEEAQSGNLTLVLSYNGFSLTKEVELSQKAAASASSLKIELSAATKPASNFPEGSAGGTTAQSYTIGGYDWTFSPSSGNKFSWYSDNKYILWGKSGAFILMPGVEGKKLVSVTILTGKNASTKVSVGVYNEAGTAAVSGGAAKTLSAQDTEFSWNLTGTTEGARYQLRVTSAYNAQLQKLVLIYE